MADFPKKEGKTFVFSRYGLAPTLVFRNPNLSVTAKAIYGYLSTFINAEQMKKGIFKAWPSRWRILKELNISCNTLSRYLKELKEAGFINVEQSRTIKDGRQVYGNNLYILQPYVEDIDGSGEISTNDQHKPHSFSNSSPDRLNSSDSHQVNTSNTMGNTDTNTNKDCVTSLPRHLETDAEEYWKTVFSAKEEVAAITEEVESNFAVAELIAFWNEQGIKQHQRLGKKTRRRIAQAWAEALEDYSEAEILGAIINYSKLYKIKRESATISIPSPPFWKRDTSTSYT